MTTTTTPSTGGRLSDIDMYHARAAECRSQADEATLQNVKDRCLRAEEAWKGMASRLERHEKLKETSEAAKALRID